MNIGVKLLCFLFAALAGCACACEQDCPDEATLRERIDQRKEKLAEQGVQLSAFGDAHSAYMPGGGQNLDIGTMEVDAILDIRDELQGALAVVKDPLQSKITVGFIDYHTFGGRIAPRGRLWVENGLHIQAGRFDVPFGSDWQFFASKDSISISRPLTTELIMNGGYNDVGVRVLGNNGSINFNTFLLQGFNKGQLIGGRVGLTPFSDPFSLKGVREPKIFELGLSCMYDANSNWRKNENSVALDAEGHLDAWTGRFEYLVRMQNPALNNGTIRMHGWHITQEYALPQELSATVFARYEQGVLRPAETGTAGYERDTRVAAGFSKNFDNLLLWKFEMQHYLSATPTSRQLPGYGRGLYTQLVVML